MIKLVCMVLLSLPGIVWAQPAITFDAMKHDFGTVMQGPLLEHAFGVTNSGTEDLVITDVNTS